MPRKPRNEIPGGVFHVTARGNDHDSIVYDDRDRVGLLTLLAGTAERYGWLCHAFCLMDTHLHLLVGTPQANLGVGMQRLLGGHARRFNQRHGRRGHVFGERFHAAEVVGESHLLLAAVHIVMNPVRAGLVRHPDQWRWSSFRSSTAPEAATPSVSGLAPALLDGEPERGRRRFLELVDAAVADHGEGRAAIRIRGGAPLGSG